MKKRLLSILTIIACLCLVFNVSVTNVSATGQDADASGDNVDVADEPVDDASADAATPDTDAGSEDDMVKESVASQFASIVDPFTEAWVSGIYSDFDFLNKYNRLQFQNQYGFKYHYDISEEDYNSMFESLGEFKKMEKLSKENVVAADDTKIEIQIKAIFENDTVVFDFTCDFAKYEMAWKTSLESAGGAAATEAADTAKADSDEEDSDMGDLVAKAGMNTLMGMGTVFVVLIFISFIISLFKFINKTGSKKTAVEPTPVVTPAAPVAADTSATDDDEIAAVIAAAIAAYEADEEMYDVPADGLFVRSIRKRGFC